MSIQKVAAGSFAMWSQNKTATRELKEDFARTVIGIPDLLLSGDLNITLMVSAITAIYGEVFDWEAAEKRADWEESHGRFVEFGSVKDLLTDLHL